MTAGGWIIMLVSVGTVATLFVWCIYKVLTAPTDPGRMHRFEIETPDVKADRERE